MKRHLEYIKLNKKGFTLIEMIVVIAIIGILAAILVPSMAGYLSTARTSKQEANAKTVYTAAQSAVTSFEAKERLANGTYIKGEGEPSYTPAPSAAPAPTPSEGEDNQQTKLFNKISELIGATNYGKFKEIKVKIADGAVEGISVTEQGETTPTTYPKNFTFN